MSENKIIGDRPAFGCVAYDAMGGGFHEPGLTKREYFAAMAMQGLLTKYTLNTPADQSTVADLSVQIATELIAALNQTP